MGLPCIGRGDQVIAVLAPAGTTLEVPDCRAAEGARHQYRWVLARLFQLHTLPV